MFSQVKTVLKNPRLFFPYLILLSKKLQVKRIKKDGAVFYKYKGDFYPEYLNNGNACAFILEKAKHHCQGKGIDIGADAWPFPGAIPVHNDKDQNAYQLDRFSDNSLDYVFSSHCLEHLEKWESALKLWIKKIRPDGTLFLYLPHSSMRLWNPGSPWGRFGHKWIPTCEAINKFLSAEGMKIVECNTERDGYWSFHIVAKKIR